MFCTGKHPKHLVTLELIISYEEVEKIHTFQTIIGSDSVNWKNKYEMMVFSVNPPCKPMWQYKGWYNKATRVYTFSQWSAPIKK